MEKYVELSRKPPTLIVKNDAKEVIIHLVSCMCDNKALMTLKKNSEGDFKLSTNSNAYSNFQIHYNKYEIEWAADNGDWDEVFRMINSGTSNIEKIASR